MSKSSNKKGRSQLGGRPTAVILDTETFSRVNVKEVGSYRYVTDDSTELLCLGYAFRYDKKKWGKIKLWHPRKKKPKDLLKAIRSGVPVYIRNIGFEKPLWRRICVNQFGWPDIADKQWMDLMAIAGALALPLSMEKSALATGQKQQKDKAAHSVLMKLCKPRRNGQQWSYYEVPEDYEKLYKYCKQDVRTEIDFLRSIPRELSPKEKKVFWLCCKINDRGVGIDTDMASGAITISNNLTEKIDRNVREITNGVVLGTSKRIQVLNYSREMGYELESYTKDYIAETLKDPDLPDVIRTILEGRQILGKTSTAKYVKMLQIVDDLGRAYYTMCYHAATTGRWGGRMIQPHNFPRGVKPLDWKTIEKVIPKIVAGKVKALYKLHDNPFEVLSTALRQCIIAKTGQLLINDFVGIENRGVAWVTEDYDTIKEFNEGLDQYIVMASFLYGKKYEDINDAERWFGKTLVLGAGYGLGWRGFIKTCENYDIPITEKKAKKAIDAYREKYPMVVRFWYGIEEACFDAMRNPGKTFAYKSLRVKLNEESSYLFIRLPSGRLLSYPYAKLVKMPKPWGAKDLTITFMGHDDKARWVRKSTYGGRLVENVVQALSRDMLAEKMLALDAAGFNITMHVHDEIVCEEDEKTLKQMTKIMKKPVAWAPDFPLDVSGFTSKRYRKE